MSFPIRVKVLKVMDWFPSTLYSGFPKQSWLLHKAKQLCTTQMCLASQGWKSLPALLGKLCALLQGLKNKVWVSIPLPDKAFITKFFFWRWFLYYYYFIWFDSTYISSPISLHLSFFKTALLSYKWYTKNCAYLLYTIWWAWTHINTHDTITTMKVIDISISPRVSLCLFFGRRGICLLRFLFFFYV